MRALHERSARELADLPMHFDPGGREVRLIGPSARSWLNQQTEPAHGAPR